jgi:DNA mismatch repair ATPase MutS
MRKLILPLAILAMAALLGGAVALDCLRLAWDGHSRVLTADGQMAAQEIRLVKALNNSAKKTPEVESSIASLKSKHDRRARIEAYDSLVASFRNSLSGKIDPTDPLDRKFMDEAAGAINRREVAKKQYDEELAAYQNYLNSWRGRVARVFSSQARSDSAQSP